MAASFFTIKRAYKLTFRLGKSLTGTKKKSKKTWTLPLCEVLKREIFTPSCAMKSFIQFFGSHIGEQITKHFFSI